ncbi:PH domain-containing protein [[Limnothrix rosea] IAM M-220]|jgi:hypothetical protein|uniref:PH domain-containing protein n=1 Tax=[Limnothrix rosea] IAM M-220 TaxID=454133 RepID=UPI00095C1709|nr:PH domain-containing protein [[Limnothrix rosea] IAM M-220]OKH19394.1 ribonuclease P [[Limnothrix rosea] IAM M-220]
MGIKEDVIYEGGPHIGDLIISILMGFTLIFLPLTVGAVVRALWLRYRITSRRISVTGGWNGRDRTDIIYSEVRKVAKIPRGLGLYGDLIVTLQDGSRLELRSMPKFREIYDHIAQKASDRTGVPIEAIAA